MAFWITYSGHQPYTLSETETAGLSTENVERIREKYPDLSDEYVSYLAKNMDLDQALEEFMTTMAQAGKLDDVVFIVFGDHMAKGLDFSEGSSFYEETGLTYAYDMGHTELFFYCTGIDHQEVYQRTGTCLDLLPTAANLWGLTLDTQEVLGSDLFDPDYHGMYFDTWGNWLSDYYWYNSVSDELKLYDENDDRSQAEEEIYYHLELQEVSDEILSVDYFGGGAGIDYQDDVPSEVPW